MTNDNKQLFTSYVIQQENTLITVMYQMTINDRAIIRPVKPSFFWPYKCLLTITLLASPMLIDNHSSGHTSAYWQSLFWPYKCLLTITLLATPMLINNHSSGLTNAYWQSLFWPYKCLLTITLLALPMLIDDHSYGHTSIYMIPIVYNLCIFTNNPW